MVEKQYESGSFYSVFVEHIHSYKKISHFETNLYLIFSFLC